MAKKYQYFSLTSKNFGLPWEAEKKVHEGWRVVTVVQLITPTSGTAPGGEGFGYFFEREIVKREIE